MTNIEREVMQMASEVIYHSGCIKSKSIKTLNMLNACLELDSAEKKLKDAINYDPPEPKEKK